MSILSERQILTTDRVNVSLEEWLAGQCALCYCENGHKGAGEKGLNCPLANCPAEEVGKLAFYEWREMGEDLPECLVERIAKSDIQASARPEIIVLASDEPHYL